MPGLCPCSAQSQICRRPHWPPLGPCPGSTWLCREPCWARLPAEEGTRRALSRVFRRLLSGRPWTRLTSQNRPGPWRGLRTWVCFPELLLRRAGKPEHAGCLSDTSPTLPHRPPGAVEVSPRVPEPPAGLAEPRLLSSRTWCSRLCSGVAVRSWLSTDVQSRLWATFSDGFFGPGARDGPVGASCLSGLCASGLSEPPRVQGAPPPCTQLLEGPPGHRGLIIPFFALSSVVVTHKILRKARGNLEVMNAPSSFFHGKPCGTGEWVPGRK